MYDKCLLNLIVPNRLKSQPLFDYSKDCVNASKHYSILISVGDQNSFDCNKSFFLCAEISITQ